jgi:thiol:disulfide interchange protein DsbA
VKASRVLPRLAGALMAGFLWLALPASAAPVAGKDYKLLASPQTPDTEGKIEVIEFFSYGCPHCYDFNPLITQWAKQLPANVAFVRVPISLGRQPWGQLVRAFYALQATGDLERLDTALFDAIHKEHQALFDEASLTAWAAKHGIAADKFKSTLESFNVSTRSSHAERLARDYQVQGVPHLVIDGKYEILGQNYNELLKNASAVLEMLEQPGKH